MHSVAIHTPFAQVCIRAGVTIATLLGVSQDRSCVSRREGKLRPRHWIDPRYEPTGGLVGDASGPDAVTLTRARYDLARARGQWNGASDASSGSSAVIAKNELTPCHERARDVHGATPRPSGTPFHGWIRGRLAAGSGLAGFATQKTGTWQDSRRFD